MSLKQKILRLHVYLILAIASNFFVRAFSGTGLHVNLVFSLKLLFYLTGIVLFFMHVRPYKKGAVYFSLYVVSPILVVVAWLVDGVMGAILGSFFLFFLWPPNERLKDGDYVFYERFGGFMGTCCTFDVVHNRFFILQERIGEYRSHGMNDFKGASFRVVGKRGYLSLTADKVRLVDTVALK